MKSVVITGASTGIGRACALMLDRNGFRVLAGVRKDADGDALRSAASGSLTPVHIDVTDAASIQAMADEVKAEVGEAGLYGSARGRVTESTRHWNKRPLNVKCSISPFCNSLRRR